MFGKRKATNAPETASEPKPEEKPTPAYLRDDYPYKAVGDPIEDLSTLDGSSDVCEIWCGACQTSLRTQGKNIRETYERLMAGNGCLGCGSKELVVRHIDMSKAPAVAAKREASAEQKPADTV